jgi:two-component system, OmpR family, sensor kinase
MPIRARITLISAGLVAAVLAATGFFLFVRLESDLRTVVDEGLDSRADVLVARVDGSSTGFDGEEILGGTDEAFAQILGPNGAVLDSSPGLRDDPIIPPDQVRELRESRFFEATVPTDEEPVSARLLAVPTREGPVIIVGASLEHQQESLSALLPLLWIGGPVALILVTGVVWVLTGAALRPVERMRAEAEAFSLSEPGHRLPVPTSRDEIARLGETLNRLLGRLEDALDKERRFVDDASHELRTPLAVLKTELELALRESRSRDELEAALRSAAEESDNLSRIAEDLLVLARADRGRLPVSRTELDLVELARNVAEGFMARAADRRVEIQVRGSDGSPARVDPLRVRQALSNILDNALRHTPGGGTVRIQVGREENAALLEVADTGPGFRGDLLPVALEPFVRDDAARGRVEGGAGLGLAIVRAVAEAHGGSVSIRNEPGGGAAVLLRLPD